MGLVWSWTEWSHLSQLLPTSQNSCFSQHCDVLFWVIMDKCVFNVNQSIIVTWTEKPHFVIIWFTRWHHLFIMVIHVVLSYLMTSVTLLELCQVWQNNPDDVISVTLALTWRVTFIITVCDASWLGFEDMDFARQRESKEKILFVALSHICAP